jgi:serine/threonine protein kinase
MTILITPPGIEGCDILGGGTSGLVALYPNTQTVIKFSLGDADEDQRCEQEAKVYDLLKRSSLPRPTSLLAYKGRSECGRGILLEYAENDSISRYFSKPEIPPLDTAHVVLWANQAARALDFVHANGLAHGDIRCDNMFLDGNLNLLLGDFTHAEQLSACPKDGNAFSSYEQEDIFEFGLTLYEMSTRTHLYEGLHLTAGEKKLRMDQDDLPDLTQIKPLELKAVIARCLRLQFQNMRDILSDIEHIAPPNNSSHFNPPTKV